MTYFYTPPKYWSSKLAWSLAFRGTIWFGQQCSWRARCSLRPLARRSRGLEPMILRA